jgi:hypothetical protein
VGPSRNLGKANDALQGMADRVTRLAQQHTCFAAT